MPQITVYVRNEDMDQWKSIEKKAEFIHQALSGNVNGKEFKYTESPKLEVTQKPTLNIPGAVRGNEFVPKPPDPETGYPCCKANKPCKHWQWDELKSVWVNQITLKEREA